MAESCDHPPKAQPEVSSSQNQDARTGGFDEEAEGSIAAPQTSDLNICDRIVGVMILLVALVAAAFITGCIVTLQPSLPTSPAHVGKWFLPFDGGRCIVNTTPMLPARGLVEEVLQTPGLPNDYYQYLKYYLGPNPTSIRLIPDHIRDPEGYYTRFKTKSKVYYATNLDRLDCVISLFQHNLVGIYLGFSRETAKPTPQSSWVTRNILNRLRKPEYSQRRGRRLMDYTRDLLANLEHLQRGVVDETIKPTFRTGLPLDKLMETDCNPNSEPRDTCSACMIVHTDFFKDLEVWGLAEYALAFTPEIKSSKWANTVDRMIEIGGEKYRADYWKAIDLDQRIMDLMHDLKLFEYELRSAIINAAHGYEDIPQFDSQGRDWEVRFRQLLRSAWDMLCEH